MDGYEYNMHAGPPFQTLACMQWLATSETCGKENGQLPVASCQPHHLFQIRSAVIRDFPTASKRLLPLLSVGVQRQAPSTKHKQSDVDCDGWFPEGDMTVSPIKWSNTRFCSLLPNGDSKTVV